MQQEGASEAAAGRRAPLAAHALLSPNTPRTLLCGSRHERLFLDAKAREKREAEERVRADSERMAACTFCPAINSTRARLLWECPHPPAAS